MEIDLTATEDGAKRKDKTPTCEHCGGDAGFRGNVPNRFCGNSCAKKAWYVRMHPTSAGTRRKPKAPRRYAAADGVIRTSREPKATIKDIVRVQPDTLAGQLYLAELLVALSRVAPPAAIDALLAAWREGGQNA